MTELSSFAGIGHGAIEREEQGRYAMKRHKQIWAGAFAVGIPLALLLAVSAVPGALPGAASAHKAESPPIPKKPRRIMSTNMCSDLLLLMLVPKERISSITYLAHEAVEELMPGADAGIRINHGLAEEVVRERPDLILASQWSTPVMRRLGAKVGAPVVEIDETNSFEDIRRVTRHVGALVGEPERAELLIAQMDLTLAELEATKPDRAIEVVAWSGNGSVPGEGTLTDEIIRMAGARNVAVKFRDFRYSTYGLEELLAARPQAIMRGEDRYDEPSLQDAAAAHPIIRSAFKGRQLTYPASLYTCGLPQSAEAARALRQTLSGIPAGDVPW